MLSVSDEFISETNNVLTSIGHKYVAEVFFVSIVVDIMKLTGKFSYDVLTFFRTSIKQRWKFSVKKAMVGMVIVISIT